MKPSQFWVRVDQQWKLAECFWAEPPAHAEIAVLKTWSDLNRSPTEIEAGELAQLAAGKWEATCEWGTVATSAAEMEEIIRKDPAAEVTAMLLAAADWFDDGVLGVCLFHRTWAKNVFVDFLAVNPGAMGADPAINGVGLGLLYHLCAVARRLEAPILWGETTAGSVSYYRKYFALAELDDRLMISAERRDMFSRAMRQKWEAAAAS